MNKVFSYVQQQERQRHVLSTIHNSENIALFTRRNVGSSKPNRAPGSFKRDKLYCTHCKLTGHSFETCFKAGNAEPPLCSHCDMTGHIVELYYKLHGYPPDHKLSTRNKFNGSTAHHATGQLFAEEDNEEPASLTKGQVQEIMAFLKKDPITTPHLANHTQTILYSVAKYYATMSGISLCLSVKSHTNTNFNWIIDTGAIDHMVYYTSLLS